MVYVDGLVTDNTGISSVPAAYGRLRKPSEIALRPSAILGEEDGLK